MGTQLPSQKGDRAAKFSAHFCCRQTAGCIKMPLGMAVGLSPGDFVLDGDPATPRTEGTPTTTQLLAHVYCGQRAGWMKTPLGTEVDLGPGHIVLDRVPALRETGTAAPPILSAHVYCGHGRPSQLLLRSSLNCQCRQWVGSGKNFHELGLVGCKNFGFGCVSNK